MRCSPQDVDIAEVLDTVKILMQRDRKKPMLPNVLKFNKIFVGNLKWFGRLHELSMAAILKLFTLDISMGDMSMFIKMLGKGKFKIFPAIKGSRDVRKISRRVKKQEKA